MDQVFETVSRGLYQTGAFMVMQDHPFLFTRKDVHPFYIDCSKLQNGPEYWIYATDRLAELVESNCDVSKISRISGGESRDLLFSIPVAQNLSLPHVLLRKGVKTYGNASNIAGTINKGDYVVHVADLLTQATSATNWIEEIEAHGATIDSYFVVFDRNQGGTESLAQRKNPINVYSLAQMSPEFFEIGIDLGMLSRQLFASIQEEYISDPHQWGLNYLRAHPWEIAYILETDGPGLVTTGYPAEREELVALASPYITNVQAISGLQ